MEELEDNYLLPLISKIRKVNILFCFIVLPSIVYAQFSPSNNSYVVDTSIVFRWNIGNGVHEFALSTDSLQTQNIITTTVLGSSFTVTGLSLNTKYFWTVNKVGFSNLQRFSFKTISPIEISSLNVWLKADDGVLLVDNKVTEWTDKSIKGNSFLQSDLNSRPSFNQNISELNNRPGVYFDGIDDFMRLTNNITTSTVYIIANYDSDLFLFSDFKCLVGTNSPNSFVFMFLGEKDQSTFYTSSSLFGNSLYINNVSTLSFSPLKQHKLIFGSVTPVSSNIALGIDRNDLTRCWKGNVVELLVFDKILDKNQKTLVDEYLFAKYSPKVDLGNDTILSDFSCSMVLKSRGGKFTDYLWSTGETGDSIIIDKPGKYYVSAKAILGNITTDTISVGYQNYPVLLSDTTICYGQKIIWNPNITNSGYNINWLKNGSFIDNGSLLNISTSGIFTISITGVSAGCSLSKNITVLSDSFPKYPIIADTSICARSPFAIERFGNTIKSYLWNGLTTTTSFSATTSGGYSLKTVNQNNCVNTTFFNVSITGIAPTVNFTSSLPFDTACINAPVIFNNFTSLPIGVAASAFRWDFGNGLSNNIIWTPQSTTYTTAGSYFVTLSVVGNNGCFNSFTRKILALNIPVASFSVLPALKCQKDTIQFSNNSLPNNVGVPLSSYIWNFGVSTAGSLNISTTPNGKFSYTNFGTYTASFIVANKYGCSNTSKQLVSIAASPISDFTFTKGCLGTPISFVDITQNPTGTFTQTRNWDFGNGSTSNTINNTISYSNIGQFPVTFRVTNNLGCVSTNKKTITVKNAPIPIVKYGPVCKNNLVQFYDSSTIIGDTIVTWQWQIANSISSTIKNPKVLLGDTGNYQVSLTVGTKSCSVSMARPEIVKVNGLPLASFSALPDFGSPPLTVTLTSSLTGISNWKWNFGNSTSTSLNTPPLAILYSDSGVYPIKLIVFNQNGCSDSLVKSIIVSKPIIDLAVSDLGVLSNNGIQTISVMLSNKGNIPLKGISLKLKSKEGFEIVENTNIELSPSASYLYSFTSQIPVNTTKYPFYCVEAHPISLIDSRSDNNTSCKLISSDFYVGLPFPNPTSGDTYLPISLLKGDDVTISLVDIAGKQSASMIYKFPDNGYETIQLPTSVISGGVYLIFISMKDQIIIRKLIKY